MSTKTIKLPDIGEGIAEVEIAEVLVSQGDTIQEDDVLAAVVTDKATVEIPAPTSGSVSWVGIVVGQKVAVGAPIFAIEVLAGKDVATNAAAKPPEKRSEVVVYSTHSANSVPQQLTNVATEQPKSGKASNPLASPAVRARAREHGIDLRSVAGSGPAGRIGHEDLDAFIAGDRRPSLHASRRAAPNVAVEEIKIAGLRRSTARRMQKASQDIAHFSYVEEVDVSDLESLRAHLNTHPKSGQRRLTLLPFVMRAVAKALQRFPQFNAHFDSEAEVIKRVGAVHLGIATQTQAGLLVPVVRHVETLGFWECASGLLDVVDAARSGKAKPDQLSGSTLTITSLGALGGLVTTPIINMPEVAIVGINKISTRPVWSGTQFIPRQLMNLSCSFDHRVIDGWEAAEFVQMIRQLLEVPATMFLEPHQ